MKSVHPDGKTLYSDGQYWGIDRICKNGQYIKPGLSDIVRKANFYGFYAVLEPGQSTIQKFTCPKCKGLMVKFWWSKDRRNRIHACKDCGYRYRTAGIVKALGTFTHF
jgi:hypothetical protein